MYFLLKTVITFCYVTLLEYKSKKKHLLNGKSSMKAKVASSLTFLGFLNQHPDLFTPHLVQTAFHLNDGLNQKSPQQKQIVQKNPAAYGRSDSKPETSRRHAKALFKKKRFQRCLSQSVCHTIPKTPSPNTIVCLQKKSHMLHQTQLLSNRTMAGKKPRSP